MSGALPSPSFWRGKRVLVTGHTGFKGSWLALWLARMGAEVTGLALAPETEPNLFTLAAVGETIRSHFADLRDPAPVAALVREARPEIVLHLAAQALVRASYRDPLGTFATNVQGTAHVLDAVRHVEGVRVVVAITTDKVYQNHEHAFPYRETDALGGHDPYSASKAASEIVIASYRDAFLADRGVAVASARAGNVIGGGDWASERLVPDAARAWTAGRPLVVRRPGSVRPWQHVLEPISAYLCTAERLFADPGLAGAYNFGPHTHEAATVREVISLARDAFGSGEVEWGTTEEGPHEAGTLKLEIARAASVLGVAPRWPLRVAVERTMRWYAAHAAGASAASLCAADVDAYVAAGGAA